jgi:hypothetical protein
MGFLSGIVDDVESVGESVLGGTEEVIKDVGKVAKFAVNLIEGTLFCLDPPILENKKCIFRFLRPVWEFIVSIYKCFDPDDFFNEDTCPIYFLREIIVWIGDQVVCTLTAVDVHDEAYRQAYDTENVRKPPPAPFLGDRSIREDPSCYIINVTCPNVLRCRLQPIFKISYSLIQQIELCIENPDAPLQCEVFFGITVQDVLVVFAIGIVLFGLSLLAPYVTLFNNLFGKVGSGKTQPAGEVLPTTRTNRATSRLWIARGRGPGGGNTLKKE